MGNWISLLRSILFLSQFSRWCIFFLVRTFVLWDMCSNDFSHPRSYHLFHIFFLLFFFRSLGLRSLSLYCVANPFSGKNKVMFSLFLCFFGLGRSCNIRNLLVRLCWNIVLGILWLLGLVLFVCMSSDFFNHGALVVFGIVSIC